MCSLFPSVVFATRTASDAVSRRREPNGGPLPRVLQDERRAFFRRGQNQAGGDNDQGECINRSGVR